MQGLRDPLSSIRSCAELLAESDLGTQDRLLAQEVIRQCDRMAAHIKSLVGFAADGGAMSPGQIIASALLDNQPAIAARRITLDITVDGDCPLSMEDAGPEAGSKVESGAGSVIAVLSGRLAEIIDQCPVGSRLKISANVGDDRRVWIEIDDGGEKARIDDGSERGSCATILLPAA